MGRTRVRDRARTAQRPRSDRWPPARCSQQSTPTRAQSTSDGSPAWRVVYPPARGQDRIGMPTLEHRLGRPPAAAVPCRVMTTRSRWATVATAFGLLLLASVAACRTREPNAAAVPTGDGRFCAKRPRGSTLCVRTRTECEGGAANPSAECMPVGSARCFTFVAKDGTKQASCKMTASECERQAAIFERDEVGCRSARRGSESRRVNIWLCDAGLAS